MFWHLFCFCFVFSTVSALVCCIMAVCVVVKEILTLTHVKHSTCKERSYLGRCLFACVFFGCRALSCQLLYVWLSKFVLINIYRDMIWVSVVHGQQGLRLQASSSELSDGWKNLCMITGALTTAILLHRSFSLCASLGFEQGLIMALPGAHPFQDIVWGCVFERERETKRDYQYDSPAGLSGTFCLPPLAVTIITQTQ